MFADTLKRIIRVLGGEWLEWAKVKFGKEAIAVTQVNDVGAFVEMLEEVRLWVVLERKTRCAGGLHVQWEGKRSRG